MHALFTETNFDYVELTKKHRARYVALLEGLRRAD
jgi:hypothetical protein